MNLDRNLNLGLDRNGNRNLNVYSGFFMSPVTVEMTRSSSAMPR